ncbi:MULTISPECIES: type IV pilus biogenesis protein PilM [unclassified Pseudomonas]|uniref:type IV pilus biogenesis protein PilM n=1 Tax=unclassified Pseudomonas TaxID=196821 RepID=UPI000F55D0DB|nr:MULTISPECIES: type IV pilus biogenesis protein PilM [unclassified Pseudomonas]AZF03631.1 Conjugative transfer protein PilM in PFGI-1-like cluster [Pseudomonas sp. R5-89-07]AZF46105.1 Conjugative transfer protein PilM in PFGI-1-like cluster [Pseudomonas sp. R2-7-07]
MTMQWLVLMVVLIASSIFMENQHQDQRISDYATLDSLGRGFLVYRSAATEFAQSNPGFSGIPNDSALNLPGWFVKPMGIGSYITAGTAYTYFDGVAPSGLASVLVDLTKTTTVGVKRSGMLISQISGTTAIAIPPPVPEGAIVAIN